MDLVTNFYFPQLHKIWSGELSEGFVELLDLNLGGKHEIKGWHNFTPDYRSDMFK